MTNHIKIYGVKPRIQYVANGNLKKYEFPFAIFKTSDVDVYLDDKLLTTSEYEVSVEPDIEGGSISFNIAPANGKVITIARNLSIERTTDFQEGGALRANVLNDELDYQIACQQQIADSLNRSMVLPPYAVDTGVDLTLPTPSAGKAIVWNKDGTNLENSTVKVNELESTLKGYKTEAQNAATTAINKADIAVTQAQMATIQANISTTKATEAMSAVNQLNGMRTNCITEIPQNIKFELNNGILTLKEGSKAYKKSDTSNPSYVLTSDKSVKQITNGLYFVSYDGTNLITYLTTTYDYSTLPDETSLPLAVITVSGGNISSIDQIFNGFGYIASTIFVLPGVKGLIPNGRNADGTLKNSIFSTTSIVTRTNVGTNVKNYEIALAHGTGYDFLNYDSGFYVLDDNYLRSHSGTIVSNLFFATYSTDANKKITSFIPKTVFRSMDYIDQSTIIRWGMPDYSAGVSVASGDVMASACFVYITPVWNGETSELTAPFCQSLAKNTYNGSNKFENSACFICDKGETVSFTNADCYAYPLKGV